ncbi:hypothetical protein [Streptomyces sp. NBC_00038]|nr:hypothetical protein [Streptomyces sp. NBC_00038]MCX5554407.1 hypothetical protein [Streptomyces sp. NBC_00038]
MGAALQHLCAEQVTDVRNERRPELTLSDALAVVQAKTVRIFGYACALGA